MKTVLAALDSSLADRPVIGTARALADVLGTGVHAVHVRTNGHHTARSAASAAGVAFLTTTGPVVERLVDLGESDDVVAVVIGARGRPRGRHALGGTAAAVATGLRKPVVVVPPDASVAPSFQRVLVPLEGAVTTLPTASSIFELASTAQIDVVALHVLDEESIPAFTDQPQHEQSAWAREFLARYCPSGLESVRLETRIGRTEELVTDVAEQCGCDLIALGWSQELEPGRAQVVRATLHRSRLPVILVPVTVDGDPDGPAVLVGAGSF